MKIKNTLFSVLPLTLFLHGCSNVEVAPLGTEIVPQGEDKVIKDISDLLTNKIAEQYKGEKVLRDTHPKANACLRGTFKVHDDIATEFQHGVFQPGAEHPVWMRLSNAVEEVTSDYAKDFRGLAMKLTKVNGERVSMSERPYGPNYERVLLPHGDEKHTQDFMFLGHDAFFAAGPDDFFDFFSSSFISFALTHPRGVYNILQGEARRVNPLNISWNSVTGYALGEKNAEGVYQNVVRYALENCGTNYGDKPEKNNPDYMEQNIAKQLETGTACLDFYIQRQVDAEDMPVENALVPWDQKKSPFIKIARIDIPSQTFTSEAQKDFCENLSFNPWHSLKEHKPLGGINRARRIVMKDISDERLKANGVERIEPTGEERF